MYSFVLCFLILLSCSFVSCVSAADAVGNAMDSGLSSLQRNVNDSRGIEPEFGPREKIKTVSSWRDADSGVGLFASIIEERTSKKVSRYWLCLEAACFPGLKLYAPVDSADGFAYADFSAAKFICNYYDGWSEFDMPLSGRVSVERTADGITLKSDGGIEKLPPHSGRVRAGTKVISGDRAVEVLCNRQERISALAVFMREKKEPAFLPWHDEAAKKSNRKIVGFENVWQAFLLPETVAEKKRDPAWKTLVDGYAGGKKAFAKSAFDYAEEIHWSKLYTDSVFPEGMRNLRQTGALYRDWIEAGTWIYTEYYWVDFNQALAHGIALKGKTK